MKKQFLGLLIIFSSLGFSNAAENSSTSSDAAEKSANSPDQLLTGSELQKQTKLLEHQNKILSGVFNLLYNAAAQKEEELKHYNQEVLRKRALAQEANKPWIDKSAIMALSGSQCNLEFPRNDLYPLANQANIFYDNPLDPKAVAALLEIEEIIIDNGYAYLWPTIRSIIINRIASKVASTAFEAVDDVADATVGIRPWEMLSSLTPEEREKNQILRSPEIAALITQKHKLKGTLAPHEIREQLLEEIHIIESKLLLAADSTLTDAKARKRVLLQNIIVNETKNSLARENDTLQAASNLQQNHSNNNGQPARASNQNPRVAELSDDNHSTALMASISPSNPRPTSFRVEAKVRIESYDDRE